MKKSKILILVLSLTLILSLSIGAMAQVKNPTTFTKVNMGTIDSLDPHYQYDNASSEIYANIYENLIMFKKGDITQYEPMLATKVPTVENGLVRDDQTTYVFPIREGVKFHEGGTLTPEDVKYSFMRGLIFDRNGGPFWMLYGPLFDADGLADLSSEVVGVDDPTQLTAEQSRELYEHLDKAIEVDGNNVIFHLPKPNPTFMSAIVHDNGLGAIIDKEWSIEQGAWDGSPESIPEYYDLAKEEDALHENPNGTGPFELNTWEKGQRIALDRFDGYWREPAQLERVIINYIDEWSTRKLMLQRGDADVVYMDKQYQSQVGELDGVELITGLPNLYTGYGLMNWTIDTQGNQDVHSGELDGNGIPSDFFADIHVRKAFNYAMNYDAFVKDVMDGDGQQARGPIPEPFLGWEEDSPVYTMDLDKAEEHFKQAFDGEVWEKGFEITILYNTGNSMRQTASQMLKYNIEQINPKFKVNMRGIQWGSYLDRLVAGKFTLGFIGWGADYADPHNFTVPFMRTDGTFGNFKGENYAEFAAEQNIDELVNSGVETTVQEEREEIYTEIQNIAYEYATDIYLYQPTAHILMRDWVQGWEYDPILHDGIYYYNIYKAQE